ncbi:MAG: hypothetical protein ACYDDF_14270 [Thermoplasmatota archaeon]
MARKAQKSNLRSASRSLEAGLLDRCRALAEDSLHGIPACEGTCGPFCPFRRARAAAARAQRVKDDPEKLKGLAKRGTPIGRAYAGALWAATSDSLPTLGQARLRIGTFPYANRGTAGEVFQVAMQHWTDPHLRLLGAGEVARKRGFVVYSIGEGMVCTHRRLEAPPEFVSEVAAWLNLHPIPPNHGAAERSPAPAEGSANAANALPAASASAFACAHPDALPALRIHWRSAGVDLRICQTCVTEASTLGKIFERFVARKPHRDFEIHAELAPIEGLAQPAKPDPKLADRYMKGEIGDRAFLSESEAARTASLRGRSGFLLVAGNRAFPDATALSDAAGASPAERAALAAALEGAHKPIIIPRASVALVLEAVWDEHGESALAAASGGHAAIASRLFRKGVGAHEIADLVRRAAEEGGAAKLAKELPRYGDLPPAAALADRASRAFRTRGKPEAIRLLADPSVPAGAPRGVALAMLTAFGEEKAHLWRFSQVETELAASLTPDVEALLRGPAASYDATLRSLAAKTGSPMS